MFLIKHRIPKADATRLERHSVTGRILRCWQCRPGWPSSFGPRAYLLIHLIVLIVAGAAGFWLFYVQHQFEGVYWERREEWDYTAAALQGSSFYKLPKSFSGFQAISAFIISII